MSPRLRTGERAVAVRRARHGSGDQLGERERLGQVVVGAEAEAVDPVFDRVRGGQHQHPRARPARDQRPADLVAVEPRAGRGRAGRRRSCRRRCVRERLLAVEDDVDGHALAPEPDRDRRGELLVVLDDEHAHALPAPPCARIRSMPQQRLQAGNNIRFPAVTGAEASVLAGDPIARRRNRTLAPSPKTASSSPSSRSWPRRSSPPAAVSSASAASRPSRPRSPSNYDGTGRLGREGGGAGLFAARRRSSHRHERGKCRAGDGVRPACRGMGRGLSRPERRG